MKMILKIIQNILNVYKNKNIYYDEDWDTK